jgi:23S rRNA-/tRNA-specific pseudouridylate synthase
LAEPTHTTEQSSSSRQTIEVPAEAAGQRLDQFLAATLEGVSRSRVQMLMEQGDVLVNGELEKASLNLNRSRPPRKTSPSTWSSKTQTWPW